MRALGWPSWQLVEGGAAAEPHIMALVARTRLAKQDPMQTLQRQQSSAAAMYGPRTSKATDRSWIWSGTGHAVPQQPLHAALVPVREEFRLLWRSPSCPAT